MQPGIYDNISNADYHGGPGISKSGLDLIHRSPMHYKSVVDAANDNTPTIAQAFGSAFHEFILEPASFDESHCLPFVPPEGALVTSDDIKAVLKDAGEKVTGTKPELIQRLKAIQPDAVILDELKQAYAVANAGRTILQPDAWVALQGMRESIMAHPAASSLLCAPGVAERSVYWNDPVTGVLCRCRPDYWRHDGIVVDLKSTDDASPEGFAKSIANWRYHTQHPFYLDGINTMREQAKRTDIAKAKAFVFIAVEKKVPYAVGVYVLDSESVELGRIESRADLDKYADCVQSGEWPGYDKAIATISLPGWKLAKAAA